MVSYTFVLCICFLSQETALKAIEHLDTSTDFSYYLLFYYAQGPVFLLQVQLEIELLQRKVKHNSITFISKASLTLGTCVGPAWARQPLRECLGKRA